MHFTYTRTEPERPHELQEIGDGEMFIPYEAADHQRYGCTAVFLRCDMACMDAYMMMRYAATNDVPPLPYRVKSQHRVETAATDKQLSTEAEQVYRKMCEVHNFLPVLAFNVQTVGHTSRINLYMTQMIPQMPVRVVSATLSTMLDLQGFDVKAQEA